MTRKKTTVQLGKLLTKDKNEKYEARRANKAPYQGVDEQQTKVSVLEQSNLEELIATVQIQKKQYAADMGEGEEVDEGPVLISAETTAQQEIIASDRRDLMSIPRRPQWVDGMTTDELAVLESEAFIDWRREIAVNAQEQGLHLTPYERNLDFWRQLWRTVERSDLLVQILDARDPDFYHCRDLARYVEEVGPSKRLMLLVNKADFLTAAQRREWAEYFIRNGIDALFFSALFELTKQTRVPGASAEAALPVPGLHEDDDDLAEGEDENTSRLRKSSEDEDDESAPLGVISDNDLDVVDCNCLLDELISRLPKADSTQEMAKVARRGTIGFVGYPNVGKSTVINALVGAKKVGMSSRPGKTKHIQTIELQNVGVTLCDCPGLVFPSVVATRAHLVINNTVPLDDLIDCWQPIRLIVEKVGFKEMLDQYQCAKFEKDARTRSGDHHLDNAHAFLAAFAVKRNHFLRVGVPDENWAARKILRDYVRGSLLHCEPPPGTERLKPEVKSSSSSTEASAEGGVGVRGESAGNEDDDFSDVDDFLGPDGPLANGQHMTKRKQRHLQKQLMRGGKIDKKKQGHGGAKNLSGGYPGF